MGRNSQKRQQARGRDTRQHAHTPPHGHPPRAESEPPLRELVEAAFGAVLYAPEDHYHLALDQGASALSEPAARWPQTSRTVLLVTGSMLARLWQSGWQPADLARSVRRELTPRHLRLTVDLIAAETRDYAAAALDARWSGQLRELEAAAWWGADDDFLPGIAKRDRADRFAVATLLLELFRHIGRLPPITLLTPPPGSAGTRTSSVSFVQKTGNEPRMLGRIRALLAKAESTEYPEEAEALTAKAQQLMAQHSIDEALLAASSGSSSEPGACRIGIDNPYEAPKAVLLDAVAGANRAKSIWSKELGFCTVVGFPADLEAVELLYTSLLVQATSAMNSAGVQGGGRGSSRTKSFRQSFLIAYAARIRERLSEATARVTEEALAGQHAAGGSSVALLPVLAAREEAVEGWTERMFPSIKSSRAVRANDYEGWTQGRAAADRAQLHGHNGALPH